MNRREFLERSTLFGIGIFAGINFGCEKKEIKEIIKEFVDLNLNLQKLENIIMTETLSNYYLNYSLINLKNEINKNHNLNNIIKPIRDNLIDLTLEKANKFYKKNPKKIKILTDKEHFKTQNKLNKNQEKIQNIKANYLLNPKEYEEYSEYLNEQNNKFNSMINLINKSKYDLMNYNLFLTLKNIAPDINFIKEASDDSGIPIEDIIALAHIESSGREFAVSRHGCINRFQINPRFLEKIYEETTYQNNQLSNYIKQITKPEEFLKNLVKNSKLNIAVGINYFKHLRKNLDHNEALVAYNFGIPGLNNLKKDIRDKIRNPYKISKADLNVSAIEYYAKFNNARKGIKELKNYLS
jgi:soluble lytic murein transglycosylase-like protein